MKELTDITLYEISLVLEPIHPDWVVISVERHSG